MVSADVRYVPLVSDCLDVTHAPNVLGGITDVYPILSPVESFGGTSGKGKGGCISSLILMRFRTSSRRIHGIELSIYGRDALETSWRRKANH